MRAAPLVSYAPWSREEGKRSFEITLIFYPANDPNGSLPRGFRKRRGWGVCDRSSERALASAFGALQGEQMHEVTQTRHESIARGLR